MQVCTSLQTDNHDSTPPFSFFTDRMPFLTPNQWRQSTEGLKERDLEQEEITRKRKERDGWKKCEMEKKKIETGGKNGEV